ncbi:MAG TPA: DUF4249 domain-containing protein [Chitinophagaceae bacterium]|nr:DUF4249 domain-containing protein [Chitinophagaceae bacterium]
MKKHVPYWCCLVMLLAACRQSYEPPALKAPNRFLVIEGVINATAGASTTILLSRTRNLVDTFLTDPERGARVQIESSAGNVFNLAEQAPGTYVSAPLSLNASQNYRLKIITSDNKEYLSDMVPVKQTPAIDSLTWRQRTDPALPKDVTIYANTHDPSNNTRYYRWDYTETWQYRAVYDTDLGWNVQAGLIFYYPPADQRYNCWYVSEGPQIAIGSSVKLSNDVIADAPVVVIPHNSEKIGVRYSALVRQYALTQDAYKYWEILQKNTQKLGTLFDAQPSQLKGNFRSVSNASEPVIGYASASTVQEQRIFIARQQLVDWQGGVSQPDCPMVTTPQNSSNYLILNYPDTTYGPYYFTSAGGIVLTKKTCLDCTRRGGTNQRPSYW